MEFLSTLMEHGIELHCHNFTCLERDANVYHEENIRQVFNSRCSIYIGRKRHFIELVGAWMFCDNVPYPAFVILLVI